MAVKYISKINNGTEDLSIKDADARSSISEINTKIGNVETLLSNI